ncbi:hypothetical protein [Oligoflexus tunisiensis]|uniref:hypothetical protein n=1 Tax=Oligoflexus tunisiensis TaxID=708132 RepID=UPI00114CE208|nr:hypothetical protein [Oligoflexus tunisiensis]
MTDNASERSNFRNISRKDHLKKTASASELAEIFGVTPSAISQGVTSGRLSKSVLNAMKNHRRFEIYRAVLEWENGRDASQVRDPALQKPTEPASTNFPAIAESRQAYEYYQAMNEQIAALKDAGRLVDLDLAQREVFQAARHMRDRLQEIPEKMRFSFLSRGLSDDDTDALVKELSEDIYQALLHLAAMDIGQLREAALSEPLRRVSDSVIGVLAAD